MDTLPPVRVGVLGRPAVSADGVVAALAGEREAGLLALLVARRGGATRAEVLEDELWDGQRVSEAALRVTVNRLRKRLLESGDDPLQTQPRAYRLVLDDDSIDSGVFEQLARAAREAHGVGRHERVVELTEQAERLWRGEAYDGFGHLSSVRPERDRLEDLRTATLELLAAALVQLDRFDDSLGVVDRVLVRQPYRETTHVLRAIALARAGRVSDAVRSLAELRTRLDEELAAAPGAHVSALELQLVARVAAGELTSPLLTESNTGIAELLDGARAAISAGTVVGRDAELATLRDVIDAAVAGTTQLVVVSGEAGLGKSALFAAWSDQVVAAGGAVLWGRCERHQIVPLHAVLDALGPFISPGVPGPSAAVARLLDDDPPTRIPAAHGDVRRHRILGTLCDLVEELASHRPLLFVVDDGQWADPLTLAFLERVLRTGRDLPLVVAITARTPDLVGSDLDQLLSGLDVPTGRVEMSLRPLGPTALIELTGLEADDGLAQRVARSAGGNPLFAEQLAAHLLAGRERGEGEVGVPPSLERLCRARLVALAPPTLALLEIAAVIGDECSARELAAIAGEERAELGGRLNELRSGRLVEWSNQIDRYRFCHGVMRQVAYDQIEPGRRAHLHLAVARSIGADTPERFGELAMHLAESRPLVPDDEIADAALVAGRRAIELGDSHIATRHFRTVMALGAPSPTQHLAAQFGMGMGLAAGGDLVGASSSLDDTVLSARDAGRWDVVADALMARAALGIAPTIPEALEQAAQIDEALEFVDGDDHHRRARLQFWKAEHLVNVDAVATEEALVGAFDDARHIDDPEVHGLLEYARLRQADAACVGPDRFEYLAQQLMGHVDPATAPGLAARSFLLHQAAGLRQGRVAAVRAAFADRPSWVAAAGPGAALQFDLIAVGAALASDPVDVADEQSAAALDRPHVGLEGLAIAARAMHLLVIRREQRRLHELEPLMLGALALTPRRIFRPLVAAGRDELGDARGRDEQLELLSDEMAVIGPDWTYLATLAFGAEIAAASGAVRLGAEIESRLALQPPQVVVACSGLLVVGHVDRYTALLARLRGDLDEAVELFGSARSADAGNGMALWAAWAAQGEAEARLHRRRAGDPSTARQLLSHAAQVAVGHGSARLERAVADTLATGSASV